MEVRAIAKYVRVQPRKVRIIADEVRGKNAEHVVALLRYHTGKGAKALRKVLISAMHNAEENNKLSMDTLKIAAITVDEGPRLKRMQARAMGRGNRIIKKTSHITVVVEDAPLERAVKPHGTKAKPRPTFAASAKGKKGAGKPAHGSGSRAQGAEGAGHEATEVEPEVTAVEEATHVEEAPVESPAVADEQASGEETAEAEGAEAKGAETE